MLHISEDLSSRFPGSPPLNEILITLHWSLPVSPIPFRFSLKLFNVGSTAALLILVAFLSTTHQMEQHLVKKALDNSNEVIMKVQMEKNVVAERRRRSSADRQAQCNVDHLQNYCNVSVRRHASHRSHVTSPWAHVRSFNLWWKPTKLKHKTWLVCCRYITVDKITVLIDDRKFGKRVSGTCSFFHSAACIVQKLKLTCNLLPCKWIKYSL